MIPAAGSPQVLALHDLEEVRAVLAGSRVSPAGVDIMQGKALFRVVRVSGIDVRAANILKQEMLSRGGEVATSREVYEMGCQTADCIVMGTATQFERLLPKLQAQPFGLRALADSLQAALGNYDRPIPPSPPGLDLSDPPVLMGVLNLTPDSFSDGGRYLDQDEAVAAGVAMVAEGAALVDVGGESTRPGAPPVPAALELSRVLPAVKALAEHLPGRISVDTYKAAVAAEVLKSGAWMINDISALRSDPEMVAVVRDAGCPVVLMHMKGEPRTMQERPVYEDVVAEVYAFFLERLNWAVDQGLDEENLLVDPGIGFGKTASHNLELLRHLGTFRSLGRPLVLGTSRKRFLGEILGLEVPRARDEATAATSVIAACQGVHILRVHQVSVNHDAVKLARAVFPAAVN
jgi:dihydropteroate synthase